MTVRSIPVLIGGPAHGTPVDADALQNGLVVGIPPQPAGGTVEGTAYRVRKHGQRGSSTFVRFLAWEGLNDRDCGALMWEWLCEHAFGQDACSCPKGFGQVRDASCARHGSRAPAHTIAGANG